VRLLVAAGHSAVPAGVQGSNRRLLRSFESYSEFGQELREFQSVADLVAAFPVGEARHGDGSSILLQLWSPSVMNDLNFDPKPSFQVKALTIVCSDQLRSDHFYREVLGAVVLPGEITCPWYRLGAFHITLMPNADGRSPAIFGEHPMTMLYLEIDDLEEARKHFERHKVEVIVPSDGQMMIVADPDGLAIEIWQRAISSHDNSP